MSNVEKHIIRNGLTVKEALNRLNQLPVDLILFVVDDTDKLVGSITDGDIRRGILKDLELDSSVTKVMNRFVRFIVKGNYSLNEINQIKQNISLLPEVDENRRIVRLINFREKKSLLPIDAVIMAGGRGSRLKPHTDTIPKPLLHVGEKPIIEYNIDRLSKYGIHYINISIRYLGQKIANYFNSGQSRGLSISYIEEDEALGTIGALSMIKDFHNDHVLVMNSDLLTNINYEDFYVEFLSQNADMAVATIPYEVKIPYAVLELNDKSIVSFKEKPTYTYYSNGGIYLLRKELISHIPKNQHFNATDLMELLIARKKKVIQYPILGYWLDIGKPEDFKKANEDIHHINFE